MMEVHFVARLQIAASAADTLRTDIGVRAGCAGAHEPGWGVTMGSSGNVIGSDGAFSAAAGREFLRCDDPRLGPASLSAAWR
jgi:hypothetical protein